MRSKDNAKAPQIRAWLPSSAREPTATLNGAPLPLEDEFRIDDGHSFAVTPERDGQLRLHGTIEERHIVLLTLEIRLKPPINDDLREQLDAAIADPSAQEQLALLWQAQQQSASSEEERLRYTQFLQYLRYDQGDWLASANLALEVAEMARAQKRSLLECEAAWAAGFNYGTLAETTLESEAYDKCSLGPAIPEAEMKERFYRGVMHMRRDELMKARQSLERAMDIARRLRLEKWEQIAINETVKVLAGQGRFTWARALLDRSIQIRENLGGERASLECEDLLRYHEKLGELAYRQARLTGRSTAEAREHWRQALPILHEQEICPGPSIVARVLIATISMRLVRAALDDGDIDEADYEMKDIAVESLPPRDALRYKLLRAEISLARGNINTARHLLDEIEGSFGNLAERTQHEEWWRYYLLRARQERATGRWEQSIAALRLAQDIAIKLSREAGSGIQADRHIAMHRESAQMLVQLLIDQGQTEQALCAARLARASGTLWPRADWRRLADDVIRRESGYEWYDPRDIPADARQEIESTLNALLQLGPEPGTLTCDDLPSPLPGELGLFPFLSDSHWLVFAWTDARVATTQLGPNLLRNDVAELGEALLAPFEELINTSAQLRFLAPPELYALDLSNLAWHGGVLGDAIGVTYAVDSPRVARTTPNTRRAALVFSDPSQELLADHLQISTHFDNWRGALESSGLLVTSRLGDSPSRLISLEELIELTAGTDLSILYGFSGRQWSRYDQRAGAVANSEHDRVSYALGATGLLRTDIMLQTGNVPRHIILGHCDSAAVDPLGESGAVGLAQSYIQAGSEWALGTSGSIRPDTMTAAIDMLTKAYEQSTTANDMAIALQDTKRRLQERGFNDGRSLRLWVP